MSQSFHKNSFARTWTTILFGLFVIVLVLFLTLLLETDSVSNKKLSGEGVTDPNSRSEEKSGGVISELIIRKLTIFYDKFWPNIGSAALISATTLIVFAIPWSIYKRFYTNRNVCSRDVFCPSALKSLQQLVHELQNTEKVKNSKLLLTICSNRLKNLAENNWATLAKGKYSIVISGKGSVTESDLVYELVADEILEDNPKSYINAITTYYYIPWWLTYPGLQYLESQKNSRVTRVFTFPFKIDNFFNVISEETSAKAPRKIPYLIDPPTEYLPHILVVLALHWCLNVKVYILSPMMAVLNSQEHCLIVECLNKDIAVFGESKFNRLRMRKEDNSLCAIWARTKSNEITKTLDPASGNLVFPQEDNSILIEEGLNENIDDLFDRLRPISLPLAAFANNTSFCELTLMILRDISGTSDIAAPDYQKLQKRISNINWPNITPLVKFISQSSTWLEKAKTCTILKNIN